MSRKIKNNIIGTYFITPVGVIRVVLRPTPKHYKLLYAAVHCPFSKCTAPDLTCSVCPLFQQYNDSFKSLKF